MKTEDDIQFELDKACERYKKLLAAASDPELANTIILWRATLVEEISEVLHEVPERWRHVLEEWTPSLAITPDHITARHFVSGTTEDYYLAMNWMKKDQTICDEGSPITPYCSKELCLTLYRKDPGLTVEFCVSFTPPHKVITKLINEGKLVANTSEAYASWSYQCKVSS